MAAVRKRGIEGRTYYYLEHSVREGKKVEKRELYLGPRIPEDLEQVKREFMDRFYSERWFGEFDSIRSGYSKEMKALPKSARKKALEDFSVRFTYNTNRIEGSTLTLRETALLLGEGISPGDRPMADIREAEVHRDVFLELAGSGKEISYELLLYCHRKLFESTKKDIAGRIRKHQVALSGSRFVPPMAVEVHFLLTEFFDWYKGCKLHPVEKAALVHLKLVTIHPFSDGNGRISRLMMNLVLDKYGYPMLDIPYEKRAGYYTALERAQVKDDEDKFLTWFFKRYAKENSKYIDETVIKTMRGMHL